ncbi:group II intron maturase-specific domain-containing protein [Streptomyces sp. YGL11-2]|uniref:group II intron maturase-specific domain-containing protein n=1 Tax=Streptomyces sp. YGL11-2 TaxID=3414028 RepID=UPI003CEC3C1E
MASHLQHDTRVETEENRRSGAVFRLHLGSPGALSVKLLTKPSNAALRRIRERLAAEVLALRGADTVIAKLNPIIKGWAAYYRIRVSKRAFSSLDAYVWRLVYKWAKFSHPNTPMRWVTARYFGMFNPFRQDTWVFGDRVSGFYLYKFAWTPIVRHRRCQEGRQPRPSRPGRLLGQAAQLRQTPAGQRHLASVAEARLPMSALRRAAAARRP